MTTTTITTTTGDGTTTEPATCPFPWLNGNGKCDDDNNIAACNYDDGDCCLECVVKTDCTDCICKQDNTVHTECGK